MHKREERIRYLIDKFMYYLNDAPAREIRGGSHEHVIRALFEEMENEVQESLKAEIAEVKKEHRMEVNKLVEEGIKSINKSNQEYLKSIIDDMYEDDKYYYYE